MNPFNEKSLEEFNIKDCELYKKNYPYGERINDVNNKLKELKKQEQEYEKKLFSRCNDSINACKEYVDKYPNGKHIHEVQGLISIYNDKEEELYMNCIFNHSISDCKVYINKYPNGEHIDEIRKLLKDLQSHPDNQDNGYTTPFEDFINNEIVRYILWGIGAVIIVVIVCAIFGDTSTKTPIMQQLGRWLAKILRLL